MMTVMVSDRVAPSSAPSHLLAHLVAVIGHERFGPAFVSYLHGLCGADHFAAFRLGKGELREVAACCVEPARTARDRLQSYVKEGLWRHDPAIAQAERCVQEQAHALIHVDFSDRGYVDLRRRVYPDARDRVLLCGRDASGAFGLSVLRADPHLPFGNDNLQRLYDSAKLLIAILAKHAAVRQYQPDATNALTALGRSNSASSP